MKAHNKTKGFTLIEMSIVIIIIAFLFGSIFVGEELIKQGKIRKQINEVENLTTAFRVFEDKYDAMPGDFSAASTTFGCTAGTAPVGCNGNRDGQITWTQTGIAALQGSEDLRTWQTLSLAGLIGSSYTGTVVSTTSQRVAGVNVPKAVIEPGGYLIRTGTFSVGFHTWLEKRAWDGTVATGNTNRNAAVVDELKAIDGKIDDGLPSSGSVQGAGSACVASGAYLNGATLGCAAAFRVKAFF